MRAHRPIAAAAVVTLAFLSLLGTGTHTVQRGETLAGIAARHGTTATALAKANGIVNPNRIYVGTELVVPAGSAAAPASGTYTVARGDTLGSIASRHGTTISALVAANGIKNPNLIRLGQRLTVPAGAAAPAAGSTALASVTPAGGATTHLVRPGDTIAGIARRYAIPQQQLIDANGLTNGAIYAGQRLSLVATNAATSAPAAGGTTHTVTAGQTLSSIAQRYGTTIGAIVAANGLANPNQVRVGQKLTIPSTGGGSAGLRCPVQGGAKMMNDWGFPRSGGRFHEGNDLFSPRGTPAVAVVSGTATQVVGKLGGNQVKLTGDDGVAYYYTHLDSFGKSGRVAAGDVVGTVGNTGNAAGGPPHIHFEVHPGAGAAINPYPRLSGVC
ncbi:MAG TPA: LysM peptidoglycan-binding domain-containing protein [Acidimicrobiales bacterium]|jgi:LysM repeat protein|nr:LysM peptidoglycan-binding domain-containing protein [Acidimicrobiales bacterium]